MRDLFSQCMYTVCVYLCVYMYVLVMLRTVMILHLRMMECWLVCEARYAHVYSLITATCMSASIPQGRLVRHFYVPGSVWSQRNVSSVQTTAF